MKPIRVLIVDDSGFIQRAYREMLSSDPEIEVVGCAQHPIEARSMIKQLNPDVITLDIEMPHMDGLSFLEKIMTLRPMPVVMSSTLTQEGAKETLRALELGAVEVVGKPQGGHHDVLNLQKELISKIKIASKARITPISPNATATKIVAGGKDVSNMLIGIGASTGGVEAIYRLLSLLPPSMPPILITQHMPSNFTESFARRLDQKLPFTVKEAKNNDAPKNGEVYIAKGSHHLLISELSSGEYRLKLADSDPVSGHKPSVDMMFQSIARLKKKKLVGVILTGMGKDGAEGLLRMKDAGADTFGQNQASCVVYGMPKVAMQHGAVQKELSLENIASALIKKCCVN